MEITCPFVNHYTNVLECPYLKKGFLCDDDIQTNVGNSDAWCIQRIDKSFEDEK